MSKAAELAALIGSQTALSNRNLIINGAMQVAQRGTVTSAVHDSFGGPDRYKISETGDTVFTMSQDSDTPTGEGFANSLKLDVTTADSSLAAGDFASVMYNFEGQDLQSIKKGTSSAESVTLSFYIKSTITGTYIAQLYDNDNNRNVSKSYTISSANTWEKKTITFPADTTGAFDDDNALSLLVRWWFAAGTTYSSGTLATAWESSTSANTAVGQVNAVNSTDNNIFLTGIQLEVGEQATPFEHRSFGDELARCQRYYAVIADGSEAAPSTIAMGSMYNSTNVYGSLKLATEMRTGPTLDATTGTNYYLFYRNNTSDGFNSVTLSISQRAAIEFYNQTEISGTAGHSGFFRTGNASTKVALTAEL